MTTIQGEQSMTNVEEIERRPWRVNEIIRAVSKASGIPMRDITGPLRAQELVSARHAVMWIARQQGCWSYPQIGRLLGKRDHTTVLHGVRKAEQRLQSDKWFRMIVEGAEQALASGMVPTVEAAAKQVVSVDAPAPEPAESEPTPMRRVPDKADRTEIAKGKFVHQFTPEWWAMNEQRAFAGYVAGYAAECAARQNREAA